MQGCHSGRFHGRRRLRLRVLAIASKRLILARGSEVEGFSSNYQRIGISCGITIISYMSGEVGDGDGG
jgi:hypothetical protein